MAHYDDDDLGLFSAADLDEEDICGELIGPGSETTFRDIARHWPEYFPPATGPAETCVPDGTLRWRPSKLPPEPVRNWPPGDDPLHVILSHFTTCAIAARPADEVTHAVWRGHLQAMGRLISERAGDCTAGRHALEAAASYAARAVRHHADKRYSHIWASFSGYEARAGARH